MPLTHFEVNLRSEACYIDFQNIFQKGLWWNLYFQNNKDAFIYRCIKNSCFTFSKKFSNQTKLVNESISKKY